MPGPQALSSSPPSPICHKHADSPRQPRKEQQLSAHVEVMVAWSSANGRLKSLVKSTPDLCLRSTTTKSQVIDSPSSDSTIDSSSLHSTRRLSSTQSRTHDQGTLTPRSDEPAVPFPLVNNHSKHQRREPAASMSLAEPIQGSSLPSMFDKRKQRVVVKNKDDPSKAPVIAMEISPLSPFEPWPRTSEAHAVDPADDGIQTILGSTGITLSVVESDPHVKQCPRDQEGLDTTSQPSPTLVAIPRKKRERYAMSFSLLEPRDHILTKAESIVQEWRRMQQKCVSTTSLSITRHDGSHDELVIPHDQRQFTWLTHYRRHDQLHTTAERASSMDCLMRKPCQPKPLLPAAPEPYLIPLPPSPLIPEGSFASLARRSRLRASTCRDFSSPLTEACGLRSFSGDKSSNEEVDEQFQCARTIIQPHHSADLPREDSLTESKTDSQNAAASVDGEIDNDEDFNTSNEPAILYMTVVRRSLSSCSLPVFNDIENKVVSSKVSRKGRLFATKIKAIADYEYDTGKKLGKGNFGVVYEGRRIDSSRMRSSARTAQDLTASPSDGDMPDHEGLAIKKIDRKLPREIEKLGLVDREMRVCRRFRNKQGIISLQDIITTHKHHYLIFEKADGDLAGLIRDRQKTLQSLQGGSAGSGAAEPVIPPEGFLTAHELRRLMGPVARGLFVLHSQGYSHKDIKPANILYRAGRGLLCDFGLCSKAEELPSTQFFGTQEYASPEARRVRANRGCDYICADVYSFGAVLFELATGRMLSKTISYGMDWMQLETVGGKSFRFYKCAIC
ncbi:hypothetical protein BGZ73_008289 [Actinomortierella ambigua]|nr:hypothetical protein BGZ73_008289 [Actinomortierella ambigua]